MKQVWRQKLTYDYAANYLAWITVTSLPLCFFSIHGIRSFRHAFISFRNVIFFLSHPSSIRFFMHMFSQQQTIHHTSNTHVTTNKHTDTHKKNLWKNNQAPTLCSPKNAVPGKFCKAGRREAAWQQFENCMGVPLILFLLVSSQAAGIFFGSRFWQTTLG